MPASAARARWRHCGRSRIPFASIDFVSDGVGACLGAHSGQDGAIVIAGTGSIGLGFVEGRDLRVGGYGFPISDEGSGADLGLKAVQLALRAHDGRHERTALAGGGDAALRGRPDGSGRLDGSASATDYAALAPMVMRHADQGDPAGRRIVQSAAEQIDTLVRVLFEKGAPRVTLLGGLSSPLEPWLSPDVRRRLKPADGDAVSGRDHPCQAVACAAIAPCRSGIKYSKFLLTIRISNSKKLTKENRVATTDPGPCAPVPVGAQLRRLGSMIFESTGMTEQGLMSELDRLVSEGRNPRTMDIDLLPTIDVLRKINDEDRAVPAAVEKVVPDIAAAVDRIVLAFQKGARLIYMGAGTSGRLGVLDASECPPTFGVPEGMVVGLIAGGPDALVRSTEGAEDDPKMGAKALQEIGLTADDVVVGIAVSGRTPYVIGGLNYARQVGAHGRPVLQSGLDHCRHRRHRHLAGCRPRSAHRLDPAEVGNRAEAGAQHADHRHMIRIGKSYQNLMVDLNPSNKKLVARAIRIVMQTTGCAAQQAKQALAQTGNDVKLAILVTITGMDVEEARAALGKAGGFLRKAISDVTDGMKPLETRRRKAAWDKTARSRLDWADTPKHVCLGSGPQKLQGIKSNHNGRRK